MFRKIASFLNNRRYDINERLFSWPFDRIKIDRPIFFLGVQGGGLTLIARIFQRHPQIVFCRGNSSTWDNGENEMQVTIPDLPPELSLLTNPHKHPSYPTNLFRYWTYALDDNVANYKHDEKDITPELSARFQRCIKKIIRAYASDPGNCRFMDKSQLYTIEMPFVHEMIRECDPHFILVTRNPYAMCHRVAGKYYMNKRKNNLPFNYEKSIKLCAQHWRNSYSIALADKIHVPHFTMIRFEDFLAKPEETIRELCNFCGLSFEPDMMPAPSQKHSIFNSMTGRWYPLRSDANQSYLKELDSLAKITIKNECDELACLFGYSPEGP
ncbi:MAG: hypothetical protein A2X49_03600 [Lentisphaerae bacterium GWF2_52_8]|nr:MAG: hypothetical protein A2X49_03600 [Lentisphaerae bacterium GWF2_52_8]